MNKYFLFALGLPGFSFLISALAGEDLPSFSTLLVPGLVITLLLAFNGLCVAAEFAIISVRPTQIEEMVEAGNSLAVRIMAILTSPAKQDRYIATAQLGITIASLGLGMYGELQIARFIEPYLARLLGFEPHAAMVHSVGYIISLSLLTYLHIVFGEMIPKSLALSAAQKMVLSIARPMQIMQAIFALPVFVLNHIGAWLLKLLRVPPARGEDLLHSPEELGLIVSESAESGLLEEEEEELILNIFDFGDRQVNQVMTPRRKIQAIAYDTPLPELLKQVAESDYSRFPVYKDDLDHIIGILHLKELIRHYLNNQGIDLGELIQEVPIIPEYYPADKLLALFKHQRIHMAVVLDEFGGTAGIVTLEDLVEEVVGEVHDEFDQEPEPMVELSPGVLETAGSYLIDDLRHDLEEEVQLGDKAELPDVETVGGLIMAKLGRPPEVGDEVVYNQVKFIVLATDGLAVARAKIEYPVPVAAEQDKELENPA